MAGMEARLGRLPAPTGGINVRDNAAELAANEALDLLNLFPEADAATLRGGTEPHVSTGLGSASVETLTSITIGGSEFMIACANSAVFDVSTSSASDITGAATITVDRWAPLVFSDADAFSAPELLLVNGTDAPLYWSGSGNVAAWTFYDNSTGTPTAFPASPDPNALEAFVGQAVFKNRWFGWQANSRDFYFGQLGQKPGTAGGDAVKRFPLSAVRAVQGDIVAMETWTRDSGEGPDDYLVIITSSGNAVVYGGTDPETASLWQLVGVYTIPPPIDARGVAKFLDDIVIATVADVVFLSQAIRTQGLAGAESKIGPLVRDRADRYGDVTGWELTVWPDASRAYLNIPLTATASEQIAINTRTFAACRYEGWNARAFATFGGALYYGDAAGKIWLAEFGANDNDEAYSARWSSGFLDFGYAGWKQIQAIRPLFGVSEPIDFGYLVNADFLTEDATLVPNLGSASGWKWATGTWATIAWNTLGNTRMQQEWLAAEGGGQYLSISIALSVKDIALSLFSVNLAWTPGEGW